MPKWSKIAKGDSVDLKGRVWLVEAIKLKKGGKVAAVTVSSDGDRFSRELDANGKVDLATLHASKPEGEVQQRWAKPKENTANRVFVNVDAQHERKEREREIEKRAKHAVAVVQKVARPGEAEQAITEILLGTPVATVEADGSWVVPEVDPTTIESHLYIFHMIEPGSASWPTTYAEQVAMHEELHARGAGHRHGVLTPPA